MDFFHLKKHHTHHSVLNKNPFFHWLHWKDTYPKDPQHKQELSDLEAELKIVEDQVRSSRIGIWIYIKERDTDPKANVDYPLCIDMAWRGLVVTRQKLAVLENQEALLTANKTYFAVDPNVQLS